MSWRPDWPDFPAAVRGPATDSLPKAVEVAGKLGPQGIQLAEISKTAFLAAMHASTIAMAAIVGVAAIAIGLWAPGRDGRQLAAIRRLRGEMRPGPSERIPRRGARASRWWHAARGW